VNRSRANSYLVALLATVAALLLTLVELKFNPVLTYSLFLGAIMVGAWHGGIGPGLFATVLSAFAIQMVVEPSPRHFHFDDGVRLAMFMFAAAVISHLNARRGHAQEALREFNEKLEYKIELRTVELSHANASLKDEMGLRETASKALSTSNAQNRALLAAIPDLMFRVDREGILLEFVSSKNGEPPVFPEETFGKHVLGKHIVEVLTPTVAELTMRHAQEALITRDLQKYEFTLRSNDRVHPFEGRIVPSGDNEVLVILRDVSALKRKETALRQLTERLTSAQEDERRRLSRELHDEIGQSLTAINIRLGRAEQQFGRGTLDASQLCAELAELRKLARSTQERLRAVAHALHPSVLEHLGLPAALRSFIGELLTNSEISLSVDIPADFPRLSAAEETSIYRIVQEAMTNALRHSGAKRISLRCLTGPDAKPICTPEVYQHCNSQTHCGQGEDLALFAVDDDGCGFDCKRAEAQGALGLTSMHERAEMIGAHLNITSAPGKGTSVLLCIALAATSQSGEVTTSPTTP
jgi:signal transduction histidine kinase